MRYPYGIWNLYRSVSAFVIFIHYEISLWDLKLQKGKIEPLPVWKLWDIPMGFETMMIRVTEPHKDIMRYPYGIWNWKHNQSGR